MKAPFPVAAGICQAVFFLSPLFFSPAPAGGADDGALVLDESAYFRAYYQFDWDALTPSVLKQDGEKLLGVGGLQHLEHDVKARLAHLKIDWNTTDWRDQAMMRFACPNAGIQVVPESEQYMNAPPPPAAWMKADFDDSPWLRQRKPFLVGRPSVGFGVQNCGVRVAYFRTRFFLPDAPADDLTLKLTYRGGARVFVNGQEIGRGRLPQGELAPNAFADDYSLAAYINTLEDWKATAAASQNKWYTDTFAKMDEEFAKGAVWPLDKYMKDTYIPEFYGKFDEAPKVRNQPDLADAWGNGRVTVSRKIWERVQPLRERVLGPLAVPKSALRKGENVLCIEIHTARFHPVVYKSGGAWFGWHNSSWPHAQVSDLALVSKSGAVPSMLKRPEGLQVWTEDPQHQVHDTEWGDRGAKPGVVRFAGAPGGTYGGQVVVGTDKELNGLAAVVSDLKSDKGGVIPAAALSAVPMKPVKLSMLTSTIGGRSKTASDPMVGANISLQRHSLTNVSRLSPDEKIKLMQKLNVFDQIGADGPRSIPADRCQPFWVCLKLPAGTPPGLYKGQVLVKAEGSQPVSVPVEADVYGFYLPEPKFYQTLMALEFSPYAVAKQYGCDLWSDKHYELMTPTLKLLSRVGNGFVFVPVISWSEFGNRDDSCIRWTKKKDGNWAWDYTRLDKFLDLCAKHMGDLRGVSFVVMHGNPGNPAEVSYADEASGKIGIQPLNGLKIAELERRKIWARFAVSLFDHMKARGQEKAMYWGYAWDTEGDPTLKNLLAEYTPGVYWAMGGHDIRVDPRYYKVTSWIYKCGGALSMVNNFKGWKNPALEFQNPRGGGSVLCLPGPFPSFAYRLAVDRAITVGCRGVARVGVDYWKDTYYDGARGGEVYLQPGMPVHAVFWPGEQGAESSSRYEAMAEAVEETEARIFIEQALDRKLLSKDLADKAAKAIFDHLAATSFIPAGVPAEVYIEYGAFGWQERSRRLYAMAAGIASALVLDTGETALNADLAPRVKARCALTLRNWTDKPRAIKVTADQPWIVPEKAASQAAPGFSLYTVTLDGFAVEPGKAVKGHLTFTDEVSGRVSTVAVTAAVGPVFSVSTSKMIFNVTTGGAETREFTLQNASGADLDWKAASSAPFATIGPAEGKQAAVSSRLIAVTASPVAETAAAKVTISSPGTAERVIEIKAFAIPPYAPPTAPQGEAVGAETLDMAKFLKRHQMCAAGEGYVTQLYFRNEPRYKTPQFSEGYFAPSCSLKDVNKLHNKQLKIAIWIKPRGEIAFNLAGSGFKAFAAEVGVPPGMMEDAIMNFEIFVDGKLRTQSNLMTVKDAPRLLCVSGLESAKEILLVTRLTSLLDDDRVNAYWADPRFYK